MNANLNGLVLITAPLAPDCKIARLVLNRAGISYAELSPEETMEIVRTLRLNTAPTLINFENGTAKNIISSFREIKKYADATNKENKK